MKLSTIRRSECLRLAVGFAALAAACSGNSTSSGGGGDASIPSDGAAESTRGDSSPDATADARITDGGADGATDPVCQQYADSSTPTSNARGPIVADPS
jgi:hypothetical protein